MAEDLHFVKCGVSLVIITSDYMKKTLSQISDEIATYKRIDLEDLSQLETVCEKRQAMRRAYRQIVNNGGSEAFKGELQIVIESLEK